MAGLRLAYLALALAGAAMHVLAGDATTLPRGAMAVLSLTLMVWALSETLVRRNWEALIALPLALFPGPGCAIPLYLLLRTAPLR